MCGARWHHRLPLPTPAKREQLHVNRPDPALKTAPVEEGEPDLHTGPALGATARQVGLLQRARPRLRAFGHRALGSVWPPSPQREAPFPRAGLSELRCASLQPQSPAAPCPPGPHAQPAPGAASPPTHVQAGVVGEQPVVTQGHILLLPFLV